jgi:hypothetical protein
VAFQQKWYSKLKVADPDWKDIEYGLDTPERLYEPCAPCNIDPLSMVYYDSVMAIYHRWVKDGRTKRDCTVAELLGSQGSAERDISNCLKSKRMKPNSRFAVRQTIKEINDLIFKKAQPYPNGEQRINALSLMDSKPKKEEPNGKTNQDSDPANAA